MRITNDFVFFFSGNDMLSNFYIHPFVHQNHRFKSSEHAFMWRKAMFFGDASIATDILRKAQYPNHAKSLGRKVKNFNDAAWDKVRYDIMKEVVRDKINQFDDLKTFINQHKDKTFVEASPFDAIWGVKLSENDDKILDSSNWKGQNLLGEIYNELKKEF
mgnify:CR=1 FL=1